MKPEGWKCCTDEIYSFFDSILHSLSINKNKFDDDNSDDGRGGNNNNNWGFNQLQSPPAFNSFNGFNWNNQVQAVSNNFGLQFEQEQDDE